MKSFKKTLLLFSFFTFVFFSCQEKVGELQNPDETYLLSRIEADRIAQSLNIGGPASNAKMEGKPKKIKNTLVISDPDNGSVSIYVFNYEDNQGFLVLSADKREMPILAYSSSNEFALKAGVDAWIDFRKEIIKDLRKNNALPSGPVKKMWASLDAQVNGCTDCPSLFLIPPDDPSCTTDLTVIKEPLLATKWDQSCGYNTLCPPFENDYCNHAPTGCVATAMAQVMRYYRFPTRYDWNSIGVTATSSSGSLAQLMRDAGYSVNTNYGAYESSAKSENMLSAFPAVFGYSSSIQSVTYGGTSNYQLVKNELTENRPVIFTGGTQGPLWTYVAGHAWVCDGFIAHTTCEYSTLYFSMNWGWGGSANGWYAYNNFTNTYGSFNYQTKVFAGIKP
jgi:Peptidase C10 family/Spi protease inhibitor